MPPIRPDEVVKLKVVSIPDGVYDCFNELIARNYSGGSSTVKQDDVVRLIKERMAVTEGEVYKNHWLDVEAAYQGAGWNVEYDKPGFNETYPATFTFTRPRYPISD